MLAMTIRKFFADETGANAIEYGLIAALIAVAIIGTFVALGENLMALFNNGNAELLARQSAKI